MPTASKKLMLVLTISMLMIDNSCKEIVLKKVLFIYYPILFWEDQKQGKEEYRRVLLNSGSEINIINLILFRKLSLYIQKNKYQSSKDKCFCFWDR